MKTFLLVISIISCFSAFGYSQNYRQIKVFLNSAEDAVTLASTGVDPGEGIINKDNSVSIFMNDEEYSRLLNSGLSYSVLIEDWHSYYNSLPVLTDYEKQAFIRDSKTRYGVDQFGFGSMGGFYTYDEAAANLDSMYAEYPDLITQKYSIGTTIEGRTIWAVKISDNPNVTENEPAVGFDALIHAREPAPVNSFVSLILFNTLGEVAVLVNEQKQSGKYEVKFDGKKLTSGVYFYRLTAGSYSKIKKMMLMR